MYLPTTGHFLALAYKTRDPKRVGVLIESAHSILAGLDRPVLDDTVSGGVAMNRSLSNASVSTWTV